MRNLMLALGLAAFMISTTGCVVHRSGTRGSAVRSKGTKCHPSQVWDGKRCVHKGKGRGARKHDR